MAILNQKRILNLIPKVSAPVTIHVSQGDVGTEIEFTLVKGDEVFSDTGNLTASVHGVREDGANFGPFICTLSGSKATFPLHSEMTAVKGSALAEIVLVDNGGNKVGSANFGILVEQSVFPLGVTYDNDVSVYESILAYAQLSAAQITASLSDEISARTSADAFINTRIDEIIAPSGEAPNPAEIVDARIGANGVTHTTLGDSIRNQINVINNYMETGVFNAEYGSIDNNGNLLDSFVVVRTNYIKCTSNQTLKCDSAYRFDVTTFNLDGSFHSKGGSWVTTKTIVPNYYYRIIIKRNDNTTFDMSELGSVFTSDLTIFNRYIRNDNVANIVHDAIKSNTLYNFARAVGIEVEMGSISSSGVNANANNRVRTNYIKVPSSTTVAVNGAYDRISLYQYDDKGNFIEYKANQTSVTMSDTNSLYRLVAYYSDDRLMNRSMFAGIVATDLSGCEFYTTNIEITTNYKPLRGLTFSVLGDSISAYDGYVPSGYRTFYPSGDVDNVNKMFWKLLSDEEGMSIDVINAFSGSTVGTKWQPDSAGPRIPFIDNERLTNLGTSPDVIIVYGGTNDVSGNPLGNDYIEDGNYTDLFEFKHAYAFMLDQLKQLYPTSKILCIAIADKNNPSYIVNGLYPPKQLAVIQPLATDTTTHFLYEFNDVIKELCNRYSCVYVDIRDCFNFYNLANECVDGTGQTHPNAFGHYKVKERIKDKLIECFAR